MGEETKQLKVFFATTTRLLLQEVNKLNIKREDLVTILFMGDQFVLFYYGV